MLLNCLRFENSVSVNSHTELETLLGLCQDGILGRRGVEYIATCFTRKYSESFWRYSDHELVELRNDE